MDSRFVNVTGDTMTGPLSVGGGRSLFTANNEVYSIGARRTAAGGYVYFGATDATATPGVQISAAGGGSLMTISSDGNITSTGTAHNFAQGSINGDALGATVANFYQASHTIGIEDIGRLIVNNSTGTAPVVFTLPADNLFPVGAKIDFLDASPSCLTQIQAPATTILRWNPSYQNKTLSSPSGGAGAALNLQYNVRGTFFARASVLKIAPNSWILYE
jgi:hypothetical protein